MSSWFLRRVIRSLGVVIVCGLCTAFLMAEPPGPGKGTKGPPGPPPDAESVTVRGVVKEFTTAPKGEVDGLMLDDDTCVHWPPHMADRFTDIVAKGDKIKVTGFRETGPKGDTKLEVSSLTNLRTNKTSENPDRPLAGPGRTGPGRAGHVEERLRQLEDQVDQLQKEMRRLRRER